MKDIKRAIYHKMKKTNLTNALKHYTESKISIGKAAELADVSIWKFLDDIKREIKIIT